jgi:acetylornithine/N-succinyldiaminopimelate aminotransferase|tara:strand:+ start:423 stop:1658 length:1236 start_codon:yes stop_codon:yes gene_type:complete
MFNCDEHVNGVNTVSESVMPTYGRLDVAFTKGAGVWLFDDKGEKYLDALSGIAVCNLGHSHPNITSAICEQAGVLLHTSNIYQVPLQIELADKLAELSGMSQTFFCNSGAEANEAAIKIARKYGHNKGIDKPVIIVMDGSFHGRTMATLTATGNPKVHAGFEPLVPGFVRIPYNDIDALKMAISHWPEAVAVMFEPIQGEGGIRIPAADYLSKVRQLCTQRKILMMLDEVQTGVGRTGTFFAYQHADDVLPDVLMLAKGLGNGMPVGACLISGAAIGALEPGNHGSTFGGNPLACRVAMAVLKTIESSNLLAHVSLVSSQILSSFEDALSGLDNIEIRCKGYMIGIELPMDCTQLVQKALDRNLLINVTDDNVVRLLPPLVMTADEAQIMVKIVSELVIDFMTADTIGSVA